MMKVVLEQLPATLEEFKACPLMEDQTRPEHLCALMLCAFSLFIKDRTEGAEAMNLLRGPRPMTGYDAQFLRDRLRDKSYLPRAYFNGAVPANSYTPNKPYTLEVLDDPNPQNTEEGFLKVFLQTAGADSPRPLKLRRKGEQWCLWEYSSILSGIRYPAEEDPWA